MKRLVLLALCSLLGGCAILQDKIPLLPKHAPRVGGVYERNFNEDRVVDLSIVRKLTGQKILGLFPRYSPYLEGYIRGLVVDYDDNPVEGVVVRVTDDKGKDLPGYDPAISDANGVYRIRFSQPLDHKRVDLRGAIAYNPAWQQQYEMTGGSLEPQTKLTNFHLFYDEASGILGMGEDMPKTIVRKAAGVTQEYKKAQKSEKRSSAAADRTVVPPAASPAPAPAAAPKKGNDDFFGGFGDLGH